MIFELLSVLFNANFYFILSVSATSFGRSQLQPIFPLLEALPEELQVAIPYLLSGVMGNLWVDNEQKLPCVLAVGANKPCILIWFK